MSVYISGMDMPSGCEGCFFLLDCGICSMLIAADCKHKTVGDYRWDENERHPECPLILVPDHGDLIDRKAPMDGPLNLREATKYGNLTAEQQQHSYSTIMMYELADVIDDAPVIISADKEEPT